jgi:hypothetical protein
MRTLLPLFALVALVTTIDTTACADNEFSVSVAGGQVTVTAKSGWHINKEYPWKITVGDTKITKDKFALAETTAVVSGVPSGAGKLKGAVCSADQCHSFEADVSVK